MSDGLIEVSYPRTSGRDAGSLHVMCVPTDRERKAAVHLRVHGLQLRVP
jgi:hypothetical protein